MTNCSWLAEKAIEIVSLSLIDCRRTTKLCSAVKIKFPTNELSLYLMPPKGQSSTGRSVSAAYSGDWSQQSLYEWSMAPILKHHALFKISFDQISDLRKKSEGMRLWKALLFTNNNKVPIIWKALSIKFKGEIDMMQPTSIEAAQRIKEEFEISSFPSVVCVRGHAEDKSKFEVRIKEISLSASVQEQRREIASHLTTCAESNKYSKKWSRSVEFAHKEL
mmetsp:Transcript_6422/g.10146  ORF Transcript_6422/g.10146 Transcript_6422/m.10146 type:complete len:220 (+) Transcript_6422:665-1324(+)